VPTCHKQQKNINADLLLSPGVRKTLRQTQIASIIWNMGLKDDLQDGCFVYTFAKS